MQDMYREQLWRKQGRPGELYPDASSKDVAVPLNLHVPHCDYGFAPTCFNRDIRTQWLVASTHAVVLM